MTTPLISQTTESVKNSRKLLQVAQSNLAASQDPHATKINASTQLSQSGDVLRAKVVYSSPVDAMQSELRRDNFTRLGRTETIANSLQRYQNLLSGSENTEFELLSNINDLIAAFNGLPNNNTISAKTSLVNDAKTLSNNINNTVDGIKSLRNSAHKDILNTLESANLTIRSLFEVNRQLHTAQNASSSPSQGSLSSLRLHNERDQLLTELATYFETKVDFDKSGVANVQLVGASKPLVSADQYSEFSSEGVFNQELNNMSGPEDLSIKLQQINYNGSKLSSADVATVIHGGVNNLQGFEKGKIGGYLELRDDKLLKALDTVRSLRSTITGTLNNIHNDGSTSPPATSMIGETVGISSSFGALSGVMTISALDQNGHQLTGSGGRIHERSIDFDNLRTNNPGGKVTIWDAINEFNRIANSNLTTERVAIGSMQFQGANDQQGLTPESNEEFLINNILLASTSTNEDIKNKIFKFDLDIEGNSYFGSRVEITSVKVNGNNAPEFVAQGFDVDRDFAGRKGLEISTGPLGNGLLGNGDNKIEIEVVVTGDNGVSHAGKVTYNVNQNNIPSLNRRIAYDRGTAVAGNFRATASNQTGVGTLKFVDENNIEIAEGETGIKGHLVYESATDEHRVALRGSNLMKLAGLNNFFSTKDDKVSVRSDILSDPNNISSGQVSKGAGTKVAVRVGENQASAQIKFTGNLVNGETIFVGEKALPPIPMTQLGTTITIGNGAGEVAATGNLSDTIDSIIASLRADPIFDQRFEATKNVDGDTLVITAKRGGEWANNIDVTVNSAQLDTINGVNNNNATLIGGTDRNEQATVYNYIMGSDSVGIFERFSRLNQDIFSFEAEANGFVPSGYNTLSGRVSDMLSLLINQQIDAESENDTTENLAEQFDLDYRDRYGIQPQEIFMDAMDLASNQSAQAQMYSIIFKTTRDTQDIIAAA